MKLLDFLFGKSSEEPKQSVPADSNESLKSTNDGSKSFLYGSDGAFNSNLIVRSKSFNGEKTPGELGNPINYVMDYRTLRLRAYEARLTSDVVKIVTNMFFKWVVGSGLKLQSEPNDTVLKLEGITQDTESFRENVEAYFSVFAKSKKSDFSGMCNLHDNASKAFETAFLGGDSLVVLRLDDDYNISVQVIDGQQVVTPFLDSEGYSKAAKDRGNIIINGIELNQKGEHIAYYVVNNDIKSLFGKIERIEAKGKKSGQLMAWMIYGDKHRIDHHRGIPQIAAILEKVSKLDRFTEASVAAAEERAKTPWVVEHSRFSDGENPMLASIKKSTGVAGDSDSYALGEIVSRNIALTENKMVYNLPIGSKFATIPSQYESQYEPFFKAIFVQVCASVGVPPEVALQEYNSNYSASRAAINSWGFIIEILRNKFGQNFYQPIYNLWLYVQVLRDKIQAEGFIKAIEEKNHYIYESFTNARFVGLNMPHIDPLKEAKAIRAMLGDDETPLISYEQASEQLGNGEWTQNYKKILKERKIIVPNPATQPPKPDNTQP